MDVDWPRLADIDEPVAPSPVRPEIPCTPEPRPVAIFSGETAPSPWLPAKEAGPRKLELVTACAICAGLKVPVDDKVFQRFALGPQVLQKLSS